MLRPLLAASVVAATLAGCLSPAPEQVVAASTLLPDVLPKRVASANGIVDPDGGQGEPSLGITADGVLWTHGRSTRGLPAVPVFGGLLNRGGGTVYRSADEGITWEKVATPHLFPDLDPDLAVDKDGVIWDDILYVGCNSVAVSRDDGATWATHPAVCNLPIGDRQYVIPTSGGTAYLYFHQLPTFQQTGMKTTDYGRTWIPTGPMEGLAPHHLLTDEGSGWGGGGFWNEKRDSVWATYTWFEGGLSDGAWYPAASVTRDGGTTWEVLKLE
ncbi:MAG TPA: hypothetical protein VI997_06240, partial [Candidatus Thermoplasmatota archaeon]|nr:hypothetical protein [Candidatus Thermoplasmatota archaeon]